MRRILQSLLVPLVAMVALWLPAVAAADELPADRVQLATEAVEGEQPGVPPGGPNDAANVNRPEEYEPNFLWGAAVGLAVLGVAGVAAVGALYYFMVHRPRTTRA